LKSAREEQDMAVRFAALQSARRLAVEALDGRLGLEIVREIVQTYEPLEEMTKEDRLSEADRLWAQGEKAQGRAKLAKQLEAAEGYLYLLPATGIVQTKIERRLSELGEVPTDIDIRQVLKEAWCLISFEPKRPVWPPNFVLVPHGRVMTRPGLVGSCIYVNEEASLEVKSPKRFTGEQGFTVMCWFCPIEFPPESPLVTTEDLLDGPDERGFVLRLDRDRPLFQIGCGLRRWHGSPANVPIETNKWYHFAGVYDTKQIIFYINGEEASRRDVQPFSPSSTSLWIGRRPPGRLLPTKANALIDEVLIHPTPLSVKVITAIYQLRVPLITTIK